LRGIVEIELPNTSKYIQRSLSHVLKRVRRSESPIRLE